MAALFPCSEEILGKCSQTPSLVRKKKKNLARFVAFKTLVEYFEVRIEIVLMSSVLCEEIPS